jgi:HEXXH motif-containing protein
LPAWYTELQHTTARILPVGFEPEMHLSASYREAPHIMYMTLHPDPLTMAEALIHETQHGKLNLLSWLDPVLHNAYTSWSESPVRPDLRPVMGVLLAVHAFVPVAAFHHVLAAMDHPISRTRRFAERRIEVLSGNGGGLRLVESIGQPTAMGERVIRGLRQLHDYLVQDHDSQGWKPEALPPG